MEPVSGERTGGPVADYGALRELPTRTAPAPEPRSVPTDGPLPNCPLTPTPLVRRPTSTASGRSSDGQYRTAAAREHRADPGQRPLARGRDRRHLSRPSPPPLVSR